MLSITVVFFLGILWRLKATTIESFEKHVYNNINDKAHMRAQASNVAYLRTKSELDIIDIIDLANYDTTMIDTDKTIYIENPNWTGLSMNNKGDGDYSLNEIATDILNKDPKQQIKWSNVYVDDKKYNDLLTVVTLPDAPPSIISDVCSTKGLLYSDFMNDFCVTNAGDYKAIDAKCERLNSDNCKLQNCCVLINGNKCMSGSNTGPTFVPKNGVETDFTYFYHKDTCYGNCEMAQSYAAACDKYSNNSTGISKECMVQMFNNYGCPNTKPDALINNNMVNSYSKTSKQYVDNYIKNAIITLRAANTYDGNILCYGQ